MTPRAVDVRLVPAMDADGQVSQKVVVQVRVLGGAAGCAGARPGPRAEAHADSTECVCDAAASCDDDEVEKPDAPESETDCGSSSSSPSLNARDCDEVLGQVAHSMSHLLEDLEALGREMDEVERAGHDNRSSVSEDEPTDPWNASASLTSMMDEIIAEENEKVRQQERACADVHDGLLRAELRNAEEGIGRYTEYFACLKAALGLTASTMDSPHAGEDVGVRAPSHQSGVLDARFTPRLQIMAWQAVVIALSFVLGRLLVAQAAAST